MAGNFWKSSHYQQWILEKHDLLRERGHDLKVFTEEEYQKIMIYFCNFLTILGTKTQHVKYHQQVIATACVYFRRFYARRSFKDIDPFLLATTCLVLAAKVEEHGLNSTSKLIASIHSTILKEYAPFATDVVIKAQHLAEAEFYLLEIMDCCLVVYHPYRPLVQFIQDLKTAGFRDTESIYHDAWRVCNDSLKTDASLLYSPHVIALGAILVAILLANREKDKEKEFTQWFSEYSVDTEKLFEIQQMILNLYKLMKSYDENEQIGSLWKRIPRPQATIEPMHPPQHLQQPPPNKYKMESPHFQ